MSYSLEVTPTELTWSGEDGWCVAILHNGSFAGWSDGAGAKNIGRVLRSAEAQCAKWAAEDEATAKVHAAFLREEARRERKKLIDSYIPLNRAYDDARRAWEDARDLIVAFDAEHGEL